jgi:hypothetical protein
MVMNQRDASGRNEYAVTNISVDRSLDCNTAFAEAGFLALQDKVGTLIKDLIESGVISGSVA